ncbi:insulinase family protein [Fulvivirga sp. M361]|uniref:M16 family metallopeptidase n=1 Tax=Fulvivirga sp. M361 TaxID=2594266 RepID=UPI001179A368|nr:pitrilysin family protein [Fulvivirga sp. M361]TRX62766.1 insulinase family protein [Fulvivirga sp. M361]
MIDFNTFSLDNGLRVIVHEDPNVQIAVVNLLYDVGSKDEDPEFTGLAHLFEHLMFGGSRNVDRYDEQLQKAGGENNAFTSPDITNYYMTLPAQNIETGFWLESDRMLGLSFDPKVLEVQRSVVIEEFKQRYLNQPYGDVWMKLRPLAYHDHPYRWPTIGKDIDHIEKVTMEDVKSFFYKYYVPNNATLVVAGNIKLDKVKGQVEKWFGSIPSQERPLRSLPMERKQAEKRRLTVESNVPMDALYMTFHMPGRFSEDYQAADLLSDVLGRDKSSRLYKKLVREDKLFNTINAHVTGSIDPGLLVISGKLNQGIHIAQAEQAVWQVIDELKMNRVTEKELIKVKNQAESTLLFAEVEILNRAVSLAMASLSGDINTVNREVDKIRNVTSDSVTRTFDELLTPANASVLHYLSENN